MKPPRVLALVIDFESTFEAERLSLQLAQERGVSIDLQVVHVDNGNSLPVLSTFAQSQAGVKLMRFEKNQGYAGGIVQALRFLNASSKTFDFYWFLNSDLEIQAGCLAQLLAPFVGQSQLAAIGPTVFQNRGPKIWGARGVVSPGWGITAMKKWDQGGLLPKWSYIPGCSLLIRAQAYESVGGMPSRYRMYYEETHLCVQLQKQGWFLAVEPRAHVYHHVQSLKGKIPAKHFAYYFARNNLYFWKVNFGIPALLQFPRMIYIVVKELLLPLRHARSWKDIFRNFAYTAAGVWDGFSFLKKEKTFFERHLFCE